MSVPGTVRAPRQDGAIVAQPPLEEAGNLIRINRQRLSINAPTVLGRSLSSLRAEARQQMLAVARDYLQAAGEPVLDLKGKGDAILMAGHQPELFHPGVWVKNFALNGLAQSHGVIPVNLIVDNDTAKSTALHIPIVHEPPPPVEESQPTLASVPFDRWTVETPYEERTVQDEVLFGSFAQRAWQPWSFVPLLGSFWQDVLRQAQRTRLLGERFAAARRTWERRWGCHNLEVPLSQVCQTPAFAWFAGDLLTHLPRFHSIYNESVRLYRQQYHIRSRNHPVPELITEDNWLETPFWAWRTGQERRGRLLARQTSEGIELRAGSERWPILPLEAQSITLAWQTLEQQGLKIRSRALTTTLFARLFLSDLFIHGIGGGKYDEVTDTILSRYYLISAPVYLVLSATCLLPLSSYPASPRDCRRLAGEARDLYYNPQRHLADAASTDPDEAQWIAQKQDWIERQPADARERRERFQMLRDVTARLRPFIEQRLQEVQTEWARCRQQARANEILQRRDYSFCLYPESLLRSFCTQFLGRGRLHHH